MVLNTSSITFATNAVLLKSEEKKLREGFIVQLLDGFVTTADYTARRFLEIWSDASLKHDQQTVLIEHSLTRFLCSKDT